MASRRPQGRVKRRRDTMGKKSRSQRNPAVKDLTPRPTKDVKGGKIAEVLARRARLQETRAGLGTTSGWEGDRRRNGPPAPQGSGRQGWHAGVELPARRPRADRRDMNDSAMRPEPV